MFSQVLCQGRSTSEMVSASHSLTPSQVLVFYLMRSLRDKRISTRDRFSSNKNFISVNIKGNEKILCY